MIFKTSAMIAIALGLSVAAHAQDGQEEPQRDSTGKVVGRVASQPVKDVGIAKTKIPVVLQAARDNTYASVRSCTVIAQEIRDLSVPLGPDFDSGEASKKAGLAELGGSALVNSLIPFRGVVREVSGAAAADRRLEAAVSAGYARRGYLRGLQIARNCKR